MDVWSVCTKKVVIAFPDQIAANAIEIMSVNHIRRLPIIEHRHLVGMITTADLLRVFSEKTALEGLAERLDDIMSPNVTTVDPYASLQEAARLMLEHDIGSLPVVIRGTEEMVGIVTERDLLNTMIMIPEACSEAGLLKDFALPPLPTCQPDTPIKAAIQQLNAAGLRRMVVKSPDRELGIFSATDILHLLSYQISDVRTGTDPFSLGVDAITKRPVFTLPDSTPVYDALRLMVEQGYGTVVVVDPTNEIVGVCNERTMLEILRDRVQAGGF